MSQENVEIVREVMGLLGSAAKGERVDELLERFDPEVQIDMTRRVINPDIYEGHAGLRRLGEDVREVWAEFEIEPERFIDAGERVIVIEIRRGRGTGSGIEVEMRSGVIWTLRQGKVIRMETDLKPEEALEATGLSE
jgi:ketosteroid isomerase-like protein